MGEVTSQLEKPPPIEATSLQRYGELVEKGETRN